MAVGEVAIFPELKSPSSLILLPKKENAVFSAFCVWSWLILLLLLLLQCCAKSFFTDGSRKQLGRNTKFSAFKSFLFTVDARNTSVRSASPSKTDEREAREKEGDAPLPSLL